MATTTTAAMAALRASIATSAATMNSERTVAELAWSNCSNTLNTSCSTFSSDEMIRLEWRAMWKLYGWWSTFRWISWARSWPMAKANRWLDQERRSRRPAARIAAVANSAPDASSIPSRVVAPTMSKNAGSHGVLAVSATSVSTAISGTIAATATISDRAVSGISATIP